MLSINTNLSSLIVQGNLHQSTNKLNQAIERMTTGYKINHASDNAANYSIATNMDTKIGAYMVAEENASMGLDMLMTAEGSLNLISDKLSRLRSLAVTAQNGTYGDSSISALESEAEALISEIKREYATTEYNGVKLFNQQSGGSGAAAPEETPATFSLARTTSFDGLERVSEADSIEANKSYRIDDSTDLVALQNFVNGGGDTTNVTFELTDDIDMDGVEFRGIGDTSSHAFKGIFNGNGHVIEKLTIDVDENYVGLFGYTEYATINEVGIEADFISVSDSRQQQYMGLLVGYAYKSDIISCYTSGDITGGSNSCPGYIGGIVGYAYGSDILNSYSNVEVKGPFRHVGGIAGAMSYYANVKNCYYEGTLEAFSYLGGIVGSVDYSCLITNSFASAELIAESGIGGLVGVSNDRSKLTISDSYANCDIEVQYGSSATAGGIIGNIYSGTKTSYNISNTMFLGTINNCTSKEASGGFAGYLSSDGIVNGTTNYYNEDFYYKNGQISIGVPITGGGSFAGVEAKSSEELVELCIPEKIGFTEENGWVIVDGMPRLVWEVANNPSEDEDLSGSVRPAGYVGLHIGIGGGNSSTISFNVDFELSGIDDILTNGLADVNCLTTIDNMLKTVSNKATEYGAIQNRLMSVLEEISVQYDNLVSSRSTIKDADMAEISSQYIQQQILQQASATLLATANQTPALALQLL